MELTCFRMGRDPESHQRQEKLRSDFWLVMRKRQNCTTFAGHTAPINPNTFVSWPPRTHCSTPFSLEPSFTQISGLAWEDVSDVAGAGHLKPLLHPPVKINCQLHNWVVVCSMVIASMNHEACFESGTKTIWRISCPWRRIKGGCVHRSHPAPVAVLPCTALTNRT